MCSPQVTTSRSPATGACGPPAVRPSGSRLIPGKRRPRQPPGRAYPCGHAEELTSERPFGDELTGDELTGEEASRLAVTALAADLEFWVRAVSVDDWVGVNDLIRTLDLVREAGVPAA